MLVTPKEDLTRSGGFDQPTVVLTKGKKYFVFALNMHRSNTEFYIKDDTTDTYPIAYNSSLFVILESGWPEGWKEVRTGSFWSKGAFISFPEWADDLGGHNKPGYYERLVDADPGSPERVVWERYLRNASLSLRRV